jgi:hypothetical protein
LRSGVGVGSLEEASREQAWLPRFTACSGQVERRRCGCLGDDRPTTVLRLFRSTRSGAVWGNRWWCATAAGRALAASEVCGAGAKAVGDVAHGTGGRQGPRSMTHSGRPSCGSLTLLWTTTTVMLERVWSAGLLTLVRRPWQQLGEGVRVSGGGRSSHK